MTQVQDKVVEVKNASVAFKTRLGFFRFNSHWALTKVSFNLLKGETLGIIGRNGCGKSTLLKLLAGIYRPDEGKVIQHAKHVSLQSLAAGFDNELSGRDNAMLSAMLLGHNKVKVSLSLDDIKSFSELNDSFYEPVKTYSTGMRARLGFSVAMQMDADVLLIDEVLGVGDSQFRKKAELAILSKINSEQTVVFVSHSAAQVKRLCDRVLWLDKGRVIRIGEATDVVEEYEHSTFQNDLKR
jgi:lipopolysaccharide transport system ATP-binding protein